MPTANDPYVRDAGESRRSSATRFRVVVAGGGVAALEAVLALRHLAEERVEVELLVPEPRFWYRPLSVLEAFGAGDVHGIDLTALTHELGVVVTPGALVAVDADGRTARTSSGMILTYEALVVAVGARPSPAVDGALTFRGLADTDAFRALLIELTRGSVRRLVFALPGGVTWPLPLYELALQTATFLAGQGERGVQLSLLTPEATPLALFGTAASEAVGELLAEAGVEFVGETYPLSFAGGELAVKPAGMVPADRVVALPRLGGEPIEGLPHDAAGFIPVDESCRVRGVENVFAAGDATSCPIKQGGLATQQADAAAEAIAAAAGAPITPRPFNPVLRGLLLTGGQARFLRAEVVGGHGSTGVADHEALWWPPGKIVGRHLAPFLAERAGVILRPPSDALPVEVSVASWLGA
jgi:sulfide:quinone oxidoreductase